MKRGDWLLQDEPLPPTDRISVQILAEVPLNESQPVHIYHGASRTRVSSPYYREKMPLKMTDTLAEIILDSPLFLAFGDKLILRSGDTKTLIAGARVLEINSPKTS